MAHKFVPRKGFKKDQPAPGSQPANPESPPTPDTPAAEQSSEETPSKTPSKAAAKEALFGKERSAKDSILKKLPGKAPRGSRLKVDPLKKEVVARAGPQQEMPMGVIIVGAVAVGLLVAGFLLFFLLNQVPGYRPSVPVANPTRLDWPFVENRKSLDKVPSLMQLYDSSKQRYELYVPADYDKDKAYPVVLFLSSEARPTGWSAWQKLCQEQQVIFVSPHGAGDDRPLWERGRIALDVLDEVRRNYHTDPDRTYAVGTAGGARLACRLAFALPELFGGVVALFGGDLVREEAWLRRRVADRLSIAWVTRADKESGSREPKDSSSQEINEVYLPFCKQLKVHTRSFDLSGQGRGMPDAAETAEIFGWLEEPSALQQRQQLAKQYPASRMPGAVAWSRDEWSRLLLEEARQRVQSGEMPTYLAGINQLEGCRDRWEALPAAEEAERLLQLQRQKDLEKHWTREEAAQQRTQDLALARALTSYLKVTSENGELSRNMALWERNQQWFVRAADLWQRVLNNQVSTAEDKDEAKKAKAELEKARFRNSAHPKT